MLGQACTSTSANRIQDVFTLDMRYGWGRVHQIMCSRGVLSPCRSPAILLYLYNLNYLRLNMNNAREQLLEWFKPQLGYVHFFAFFLPFYLFIYLFIYLLIYLYSYLFRVFDS